MDIVCIFIYFCYYYGIKITNIKQPDMNDSIFNFFIFLIIKLKLID